jgi:thiopeptide-type bacteriocin biosynthesis protein
MNPADRHFRFECAGIPVIRAAASTGLELTPWPGLSAASAGIEPWCQWLQEAWALAEVAEAVGHASPVLARQVSALAAGSSRPDARQVRRMVLATARYLLRMTGRATPFGLFAGVAPASFGPVPAVDWGTGHRALARADASWLAAVTAQLEDCAELFGRLTVGTSNLCFVRGGRLVLPCAPGPDDGGGTVTGEMSIRYTAAVQMAVESARTPVRCADLAARIAAEFPVGPPSAAGRMLAALARQRVLITSLHAPGTVTDALGYLLAQLDAAGADCVPRAARTIGLLREVRDGLARHNHAGTAQARQDIRAVTAATMTAISATAPQPVALDLMLDCAVVLPAGVARESEAAVSALARLSPHPFGTPAWQAYHNRFFERYGIGALVPVLDVTDPDSGLGFPDGYLGTGVPEPCAAASARDDLLLALAQNAALDGAGEIVLDEAAVARLAAGDLARMRVPPHVEACFQVLSPSLPALGHGEFELAMVSVSRGAGTMTGRFASLLGPRGRQQAADDLAGVPASDPGTVPAQLSFPPLDPGMAHVTRVPALLPATISLGEHRAGDDSVIGLDDLAVSCDSQRLYLASLSRGERVEPVLPHALELRAHTPPLARFLAEIGRAQAAVVTGFDWGAASVLPYLPRVRYRRAILSPARWLADPSGLPGRDAAPGEWEQALAAWRTRRRVPRHVFLAGGDRRLRLDLDLAAHREVLRAHLDSAGHTVLSEAPDPAAHGWLGGHPHEIVVPMAAARPLPWPGVPPVSTARLARRDCGHQPAASPWLYARLYGHPGRQAEIIGAHLPGLLAGWDEPPLWWFIGYRDPRWHLRLRIALRDPGEFGTAARRVSTWAARLRRDGLLGDAEFAAYHPETGRWGSGPLMAAAEDVFAADSRALAAQFAQPSRPHPQALAAAHFTAITAGFCGSAAAGMSWLAGHVTAPSPTPTPRPVLAEAVRLADPRGGWAALRAAPGGQPITSAFAPRDQAIARYRALLATAGDMDPDAVLVSLLHAHHIRAAGIDRDDEHACLRLARAAALSYQARTRGSAA